MKSNQKYYTDEKIVDEDNPEWTEEDFKKSVLFSALPEDLQIILKGIQRQQTPKNNKNKISLVLAQNPSFF